MARRNSKPAQDQEPEGAQDQTPPADGGQTPVPGKDRKPKEPQGPQTPREPQSEVEPVAPAEEDVARMMGLDWASLPANSPRRYDIRAYVDRMKAEQAEKAEKAEASE